MAAFGNQINALQTEKHALWATQSILIDNIQLTWTSEKKMNNFRRWLAAKALEGIFPGGLINRCKRNLIYYRNLVDVVKVFGSQTSNWCNLKGSVFSKDLSMRYSLWYWNVTSGWGRRAVNRLGPWKGLSNFGKPCHLLNSHAKIDSGDAKNTDSRYVYQDNHFYNSGSIVK